MKEKKAKKQKKNRNQPYIDSVWCDADAIVETLTELRETVRAQSQKKCLEKTIYLTKLISVVEMVNYAYPNVRFRVLGSDKAMERSKRDLERNFNQDLRREKCTQVPEELAEDIQLVKIIPNQYVLLMKLK